LSSEGIVLVQINFMLWIGITKESRVTSEKS